MGSGKTLLKKLNPKFKARRRETAKLMMNDKCIEMNKNEFELKAAQNIFKA